MPHRIGRIIECDRGMFERQLNVRPFELGHTLRDHPLLQLPAIIDLAESMSRKSSAEIDYNQGVIETREPRPERTPHARDYAARLLRFIDQADASITLRHIEREDGYRQIMEAIVLDAFSLAGDQAAEIMRMTECFEAVLLITSPNRVTEYHVDSECSWIFQIHGSKAVHLFDRTDKEVIPEEELERFYSGDRRAPRYKPQFEDRAFVSTVAPGTGVHIPVNAPHWLQNGDAVSISLNVVFHFRDMAHASLYRANHMLRRLGYVPATPGKRPAHDRVKAIAAGVTRSIAQRLTSTRIKPSPEAIEERRRIFALVTAR